MLKILLLFLPIISAIEIQIENGKISGIEEENFIAYRGIPYAEPPIGDLRFAPPKPYAEKWNDTRKFEKFGFDCAQYEHFSYQYLGDEDCLTLNVFVPKNLNKTVPVIVYIHGGAFMFDGSKSFNPHKIMNHGSLILVSLNYRLGVLGFLSTLDEVLPGNFGLKDQALALQWIKKNIRQFNGDPDKITITGFSAGGASVHFHFMSPLSRDLFNNGISHSGVAINPWVMVENPVEKAHNISLEVNCSISNHTDMVKCLRGKNPAEIVPLIKNFQKYKFNPFSPLGVVVEPQIEGAFLTDHPMNLIKTGNIKKAPWLISQAQDEGLYPNWEVYYDNELKFINDNWNWLGPYYLDYVGESGNNETLTKMTQKIKSFYLGDKEISKKNFAAFDDIASDRLYKWGAYKALKLQSNYQPVSLYHFRYRSSVGLAARVANTTDYIGVGHGEDVLLIYNTQNSSYTIDEQTITQNLVRMYYEFAMNGIAVYSGVEIENSSPENIQMLEIFSPTNFRMVKTDKSFGNVEFWDEIEAQLSGASMSLPLTLLLSSILALLFSTN